jgi:threonine dehydrogenase-like Zn-dependent dehydrogenase
MSELPGAAGLRIRNQQLTRTLKGDQVSLPFNIGCGFCKNCEAGLKLPPWSEQAPDAYQHFDARDNGWTKVVLKPAA